MINNEDIVKVAFYDELEKIAVNVKGLRQANNAVKNKLIRRSVVDVIGGGTIEKRLANRVNAMGSKKIEEQQLRQNIGVLGNDGDVPKVLDQGLKILEKRHPEAYGKIYQNNGGVVGAVNYLGLIPKVKLNNENKEIINRMGIQHEAFELSVKKPMRVTSHTHPNVIFKENNIVATLPDKNQEAKNYMMQFRKSSMDDLFFPKNMPYGKQRFSRHAIKRLTENQENHNKRVTENFLS